jgi:hypothetical protein
MFGNISVNIGSTGMNVEIDVSWPDAPLKRPVPPKI